MPKPDPHIRTATTDDAIRRCFATMRELRPHLIDAGELLERVRRQQAAHGYELVYIQDDVGDVTACSGYRVAEFLAWGKTLYVDDLVTRESARGRGYGIALMRWLEARARELGCEQFHLDSGTHRLPAHRLYHRAGMGITAFHFAIDLRQR